MEGSSVAIMASEWKPKPQQLAAARYLAMGATWDYTLQRCDIKARQTLANWIKNPNFAALVEEMRQRAFEFVEPAIWQNVTLALEVQRQLFAGEIPPNDGRIPHADKLLDRFLNKLTAIPLPEPPAGPAVAGPAAAIQINNYTNGTNGVHALPAAVDYTGAIEGERTNGAHQLHDAHDA
jgi:hypothetical protein